MQRLRTILKTEYPLNGGLEPRLKMIFGNALAVVLFLLVFEPFGLARAEQKRLLQIAFGFGLVCSTVLAFDLLLLPRLLPSIYNRVHWKVYHQGLRVIWQIAAVAVANVVYAHFMGAQFTHLGQVLLRSYLATGALALLPITLGVVHLRYRIADRHLARDANGRSAPPKRNGGDASTHLRFRDESGEVKLQLRTREVLYLRAAQNYVEVVFSKDGGIQQELVRSSLRRIENEHREHAALVRCHRSYVVNLKHVVSHGAGCAYLTMSTGLRVPVSRRRRAQLRRHLAGFRKHRNNGGGQDSFLP